VTIEVVEYDTAWPRRADAAGTELRDHLPGLFTSIEHIGSTAVPGLAAKPVIDLVVTTDSWPTRNEVLLRDYLRAHPAEAQRYAALKAELAAREGASATYTRAKTSLIQELTARARLARGFPAVPVWEE
jgi:GrpB-like predicted nucleotidyltransferase (UPF0157 family)